MRLSAGAPQTPPRTHPFIQEHGQHPGGRGPLLAAQIGNRNLRAATKQYLPIPTAGDSASRPAHQGCGAAGPREPPGSGTPCAPRPGPAPPPRPSPAPGLTMAAARTGPALLGQRRRDPRPELRADLAAPPAPALRPERGPARGGARWQGWGESAPGGVCTSVECRTERAHVGQGAASLGANLAARDHQRRRVRRGAQNCAALCHLALPYSASKEWPLGAAHHYRGLSQTPKGKGPPGIPRRRLRKERGFAP